MPDDRPSDRLLTYAELGELLAISADGARTKAKRAGWPVIPGNDGRARVRVPMAELPEQRPVKPKRSAEQTPSMTGLTAELRARAERAERSAEQARAEAEQARAQIGRLEERVKAAQAVALADVATARAEIAAQERLIEELQKMLAEARKPWWRRLIG